MSSNKSYGLILPENKSRHQPVFQASRNVFGDDSESDEDSKKPVLLRPSENTNRQAKIDQKKAVLEDPTVYQYDEIYDSMTIKKEEKKVKVDKKPRYIENLIKSANKRKSENERRIERQVQKEREKEGDEFADKEVFVTSAYKKKMEEMRLQEENEKREEYLENIADVTKQSDLGGFYRHLYQQKLGSDEKTVKENYKDETNDNIATDKSKNVKEKMASDGKKRNYRKRRASGLKQNLSDGEIEDSDEEINRFNLEDIKSAKKSKQNEENIDADSDFSIDDSSDEDEQKSDKPQPSVENPKDRDSKSPIASDNKGNEKETNTANSSEGNEVKEEEKPKIKVDIWKKRTVGEVFDLALKRYYERKASRGG